ncbi:uncharacterized protein LOC134708426 isoform X1 [Mytilus trossulus]|uniref:uncharacterized protein LOC134708426 isoform X1 n=2 Tax=Mytilus trossulus TaxID=6551 RepID=UPI0030079522
MKCNMSNHNVYVVVEFLREKSVEVVHLSWLEGSGEDAVCYWPPTTINIAQRIRRGEIPDKERWIAHPIRTFHHTDDYDKADQYCKKFEVTSNVESEIEQEVAQGRVISKPDRLISDDSDENNREELDNEKLPDLTLHVQKQRRFKKRQREERDSDSNDEESGQEPRKKLPAAPKAPIFVPDGDGSRTQSSSPTCRPDESRLKSPNRDAPVSRGLNSSPTCRPDQSSQSRFISPNHANRNVQVSRGPNSSPTCRPQPDQLSVVTPNRDVSKRQDSAYRPIPSTSGRSRQDSSCNCQTVIVQKLRTLEDGIKEIKTAISQLAATGHGGVVATNIVEDVIQHPLNYIHEMRDLEDKMKDDHFKNKLVQYLVSQGGHSRSDCIRRMMKKCGTNQLWAKYSLKGQKGKEAFTGHPLCRIVMKCCARVFPKSKVSDMEEVLIDFLKQAPHKPGGPKYKKPARKGQTITQDELESE